MHALWSLNIAIGSQDQSALTVHGGHGIHHQIDQNLADLVFIHMHQGDARAIFPLHFDIAEHFGIADQAQALVDHIVQSRSNSWPDWIDGCRPADFAQSACIG